MAFLDMQTILFSYIFTNLICTLVVANLWIQNRSRYAGLGLWTTGFACNLLGIILLNLRGNIPDFFSILVGNVVMGCGLWVLLKGLGNFLGKRVPAAINYVLLAFFILLLAFFIYIDPSLISRDIIFSVFQILYCAQIAWLLLRKVDTETKKTTRFAGIIVLIFGALGLLRIGLDLAIPPASDLFQANGYEASIFIVFQLMYILLTFSLFMMVNRRLLIDLEQDVARRNETETALQLSQEKYTKAFQTSPDAILISRLDDGKIIEANDSFFKLTGFTRGETIANSTLSLGLWSYPQDRGKFIAEMLAASRVRNFLVDFRIKSGTVLPVEISGEVIKIGGENYILSVIHDISEHQRVEQILQLRLKLWEYSINHSTNEIMQQALDEIEALTSSQISFYHFVDEEQGSLSLQSWSTRTRDEICKAEAIGMNFIIDQGGVWTDCIRQKKPIIHNDYAALPHRKGTPEGHARIIRELIVPILREGRVVSILGVGNKSTDYDEKDVELVDYIAGLIWSIVSQKRTDEQIIQLNSQLERLAMTDELTGLPNRRSFFIQGNQEMSRVRRYPSPLALIMFDVDRFKQINDTLGHECGDLALKCVSKIVREYTREVDYPVRLGGEEFGILLPNTELDEAAVLAERLRIAIQEHNCHFQDQDIHLTASLGVAALQPEMSNIDDLLRSADTAMYQAKNRGRNQVVLSSRPPTSQPEQPAG